MGRGEGGRAAKTHKPTGQAGVRRIGLGRGRGGVVLR